MNVGDYVIVIDEFDNKYIIKNKIAKIIGEYKGRYTELYRLEFIEYIDGHSSDNHGKYGYCWNVPKNLCIPATNTIAALLSKRGEDSS